MKDREYLMWLHERLEHVHGESPLVDYMHKLRAIIRATHEKRETPNCNSCNGLEELKRELSNAAGEPLPPTASMDDKENV